MKVGRGQVEMVSVFCPECGEAFDFPDGSQVLARGDYPDDTPDTRAGDVVTCLPCGGKFRLPALCDKVRN